MAFTKKVTKKIFEAVKILLESGTPVKEICKYLKLSDATVYVLKSCEKYEDYEQYVAEKIAKSNAARSIKMKKAKEAANTEEAPAPQVEAKVEPPVQVVEHRQTVTIQATHYMMEEMKKQNETLALVSNKLAYMMEGMEKQNALFTEIVNKLSYIVDQLA